MGEHDITFYHPLVSDKADRGTLTISTGANEITWGYNLNTTTIPTYGGEVVQILSAYTDDITITGTVRTYRKMEEIYDWFLTYMQLASQGLDKTLQALGDQGSYNQEPIRMLYPTRGWEFGIQVTSLPGFRYGRDVVAPEWRIVAHVVDDDPAVTAINAQAAISGLKSLDAGIGYNPDDEFSNPFASKSKSAYKKDTDIRELYDDAADYFSKLIPKYLEGDYDSLLGGIGSEPAFGRRGLPKDETKRRQVKQAGVRDTKKKDK